MYLAAIFCGIFVFGLTSAQVGFAGGYAGTGVGFNPGFMQPFPNLIPPLMIPQVPFVPMPYGGSSGISTVSRFGDGVSGGGETVVTRFGDGGGGETTVTRFGDGVSGGGQTVVSRFGDGVSGGGVSTGQSVVSGYGSGTGGHTTVTRFGDGVSGGGQTVVSRFGDGVSTGTSVSSGFGSGSAGGVSTGHSVVSGFGGGTGQTVVSRFGDGGSTTYVSGPQGTHTYISGPQYPNTQVYQSPGGQSVINSRFNDDGSQTVQSSHTSSYSTPGGGSNAVYSSTSTSGSFSPQSVNSRGAYQDTNVQPIADNGGHAQTIAKGGSSDTNYRPPQSTSQFSGGSKQVLSSGPTYGSTSSFTSSSNVNGQGYHETISSVNNNGNVQTYRQSSGK